MRTIDQELAFLRSEIAWRDQRIKRLEEIKDVLAAELDRLREDQNETVELKEQTV